MKNRVAEKIKGAVAKMAVGAAIQVTQMPNQTCPAFFGKPKPKMTLVPEDYRQLKQFLQSQKANKESLHRHGKMHQK